MSNHPTFAGFRPGTAEPIQVEWPRTVESLVSHLNAVIGSYERNEDCWEEGDAGVYTVMVGARFNLALAVERRAAAYRAAELSDAEADRLRVAIEGL